MYSNFASAQSTTATTTTTYHQLHSARLSYNGQSITLPVNYDNTNNNNTTSQQYTNLNYKSLSTHQLNSYKYQPYYHQYKQLGLTSSSDTDASNENFSSYTTSSTPVTTITSTATIATPTTTLTNASMIDEQLSLESLDVDIFQQTDSIKQEPFDSLINSQQIQPQKMIKKQRRQTQSINKAFSDLRNSIPHAPSDLKLSKIKILNIATKYIEYLTEILEKNHNHLSPHDFVPDLNRSKRKSRTHEIIVSLLS